MTPLEIELMTFRFVAQCLNQLPHCIPITPKEVFRLPLSYSTFSTNFCEAELNIPCNRISLRPAKKKVNLQAGVQLVYDFCVMYHSVTLAQLADNFVH